MITIIITTPKPLSCKHSELHTGAPKSCVFKGIIIVISL